MKKLFLLLAVAMFAFACERGDNLEMRSYNVTVHANQWQQVTDGPIRFFSSTVSFPEITPFIFNNGTVLAYVRDGNNKQDILPRVRHLGDGSDAWTSTIDCTIAPGSITFFYTNSDFVYQNSEPGRQDFRVVLQW